MTDATASDVEVIENSTDKPVREVDDPEELMERMDSGEVVGATDNAIIFRREIIVTDPEIKQRVADALVESVGGGDF